MDCKVLLLFLENKDINDEINLSMNVFTASVSSSKTTFELGLYDKGNLFHFNFFRRSCNRMNLIVKIAAVTNVFQPRDVVVVKAW